MTRFPRPERASRLDGALGPLVSAGRRAFETVAFWLAIGLPAVYGPLLVADGLVGPRAWLVLGLVALHPLTILLGRGHAPG